MRGLSFCRVLLLVLSSMGAVAVFTLSVILLETSPEMKCDPNRIYTFWEVLKLEPLFGTSNPKKHVMTITRLDVEITADSLQGGKLPDKIYLSKESSNAIVTLTITSDSAEVDVEDFDSDPNLIETDKLENQEEPDYTENTDGKYEDDSRRYYPDQYRYGYSDYRRKRDAPSEMQVGQVESNQPCIVDTSRYAILGLIQAALQLLLPLAFYCVVVNKRYHTVADVLIIAMYMLAFSMDLSGVHTFTRTVQSPPGIVWLAFRVALYLDIIVFLAFILSGASMLYEAEDEENKFFKEGDTNIKSSNKKVLV